jgi:hypothetical protein
MGVRPVVRALVRGILDVLNVRNSISNHVDQGVD